MGRFVEYHCALFRLKFLKTCGASFFLREESLESEAVAGQPGGYQCRHKSCGSGQTFHLYSPGCAGTYKHESRIGNGRCAGIADQRHHFAGRHTGGEGFGRLVFIELVVGAQPVLYVEMSQEHTRCAGVLG